MIDTNQLTQEDYDLLNELFDGDELKGEIYYLEFKSQTEGLTRNETERLNFLHQICE